MNLQGHVEEELLQEKEKRIEELEKEVKRGFPLKVEVITDKTMIILTVFKGPE